MDARACECKEGRSTPRLGGTGNLFGVRCSVFGAIEGSLRGRKRHIRSINTGEKEYEMGDYGIFTQCILLSFSMSEFKSRKELEVVAAQLASSPELQRETAKKIAGVVVITVVKKKGGEDKDVWVLDARDGKASLKKGNGKAGGDSDSEDEPVVRITSDDASVVKLVRGKASAQTLFMRGKLSLSGGFEQGQTRGECVGLEGEAII